MTLLFVGMTSGEMVFAGLDPLLSKSGTCPDSNKGIFTALSPAGRRNGRWSACLVPRLIVESWQGVSIEPLKPRSLSSKLGVNKTMSPLGRPGPRSDPLLGRSSQTNSVPFQSPSLEQRAASMHLPLLLRQIPVTKSSSHLVTALFNHALDCPKDPNSLKIEATEFESLGRSSASNETVTRLPFPPLPSCSPSRSSLETSDR